MDQIQPEYMLRGHAAEITSISLHPTQELLLSSSTDGEIRLWNLQTRRTVGIAHPHGSQGSQLAGILSAQFHSGDATSAHVSQVITQGRDGLIKVWDTEHLFGSLSTSESSSSSAPSSTSFSTSILSASSAIAPLSEAAFKQDALEDMLGGESTLSSSRGLLASLKTDCYAFCQLSLRSFLNTPKLFCQTSINNSSPASSDSISSIESTLTNSLTQLPRIPTKRPMMSLLSAAIADARKSASPTSPLLSSSASNSSAISYWQTDLLACPGESPSEIMLWDFRQRKIVNKITSQTADRNTGMCMSLKLMSSPSVTAAPLLFAGFESGHFSYHDLRRPDSPIACEQLHKEPLMSFDLRADLSKGMSGSAEAKTVLFGIDEAKSNIVVEKEVPLQVGGISSVKLRDDEKLFATAGWDHRTRLWSAKSGKPLATLKVHTGTVSTLTFAPQGHPLERRGMLITGSKDAKIAVYCDIYGSSL